MYMYIYVYIYYIYIHVIFSFLTYDVFWQGLCDSTIVKPYVRLTGVQICPLPCWNGSVKGANKCPREGPNKAW